MFIERDENRLPAAEIQSPGARRVLHLDNENHRAEGKVHVRGRGRRSVLYSPAVASIAMQCFRALQWNNSRSRRRAQWTRSYGAAKGPLNSLSPSFRSRDHVKHTNADANPCTDDRGRDLDSLGSARRTVSAGPATPTTPNDPPSLPGPSDPESAKAAEERRERATTPPLAYVPSPTSPNSSIRHVDGRAFTLQQPPPPRRPFRRPVQPRRETTMEDGNPSNASLVLASAHLVPRVADEQSSEDVRGLDAAKVKAIGTSLSASSALTALPHALVPFPQATTAQPIPCASPSVGSLTSASLGCAHHALTPLPAGEGKTHASPSAKLSRDLQMSSALEQGTQSAQIRRKEEDEMWDCFMQLGETPGEGT